MRVLDNSNVDYKLQAETVTKLVTVKGGNKNSYAWTKCVCQFKVCNTTGDEDWTKSKLAKLHAASK